MTTRWFWLMIAVSILMVCAGCDGLQASPATVPPAVLAQASTETPQPVEDSAELPTSPPPEPLSDIIGGLLENPEEHAGEQVEVVGYFRGWDLLREAVASKPVTRSDWVIADAGGAIYVTGMRPNRLDPASKEAAGTLIRLSATFLYERGNPYLQAEELEIIPYP